MKILKIVAVGITASLSLAFSVFSTPANADNQMYRPNLLIMVQDDDPDTTPARRQRIMSRIVGGMNDVLNAKGYNVFDQTAVTQDIVLPSDARKARSALVELARTVTKPPLDATLLIKLYASAKKVPYNEIYKLDVRAEGDVLGVRSGQVAGHFETEAFDDPVLPANCDRDCILEEVGKHAQVIGTNLARALEFKLRGFMQSAGVQAPSASPNKPDINITIKPSGTVDNAQIAREPKPTCTGFPTGYTVTFVNFEGREKRAIEEFLNAFSCVQQMRLLPTSESKLAFWYEISANDVVLNRNLRTMLDYMDVKGQVDIAGSKIVVTKVLSR